MLRIRARLQARRKSSVEIAPLGAAYRYPIDPA